MDGCRAVRNRLPGHRGFHPDVHLGSGNTFIINHAERDAPVLRKACWLVPKGRAARGAENPETAARVVFADACVGLTNDQVGRLDESPRGMRGGVASAAELRSIAPAVANPSECGRHCLLELLTQYTSEGWYSRSVTSPRRRNIHATTGQWCLKCSRSRTDSYGRSKRGQLRSGWGTGPGS
jgi:hypothetical protein